MRLRDPKLLAMHMQRQDVTQSDLAKQAQRSRQFIHMLLNGTRKSCADDVAHRIAAGLLVTTSTLFLSDPSTTMKHTEVA